MKWLFVVLWFSTWFAAGYLGAREYHKAPAQPRHHEPLCRDPRASEDLNTDVYTWCKLVPMWSTKA